MGNSSEFNEKNFFRNYEYKDVIIHKLYGNFYIFENKATKYQVFL